MKLVLSLFTYSYKVVCNDAYTSTVYNVLSMGILATVSPIPQSTAQEFEAHYVQLLKWIEGRFEHLQSLTPPMKDASVVQKHIDVHQVGKSAIVSTSISGWSCVNL